jgi:hypothetical protein
MSITLTFGASTSLVTIGGFANGLSTVSFDQPVTDDRSDTTLNLQVGDETATDGSAANSYSSLLSTEVFGTSPTSADFKLNFNIPLSFFAAHVGTSITFNFDVTQNTLRGGTLVADAPFSVGLDFVPFSAQTIQNDFVAITRTSLPLADAETEANAIDAGTTTELAFVTQLFVSSGGNMIPPAETTVPAVAVEGSMYSAVGTSDEITKLVTVFLPAQVNNAVQNGFDPKVYACEALGLAFAFGNENGATTFDINFGPSNPATPATPAGDAAFAAEAANAIFGSAATANTPGAILQFVSNWEVFYTAHGVPGTPNATTDQIDLAARGAAWGDAVGVALVNNLGLLPAEAINFLEDTAQGTAVPGASLPSQPSPGPFEGGVIPPSGGAQLIGMSSVATHSDHIVV